MTRTEGLLVCLVDLDNLVKFVLDSLNEKAFIDDCQVVSLLTKKLYTDHTPRVEITLRQLEEPQDFIELDDFDNRGNLDVKPVKKSKKKTDTKTIKSPEV